MGNMKDLTKKLLHRWHGCAKYNRNYPSWQKDYEVSAIYPICSVCGKAGWWIWGYKHFMPDKVAQKVQGAPPSATDRYWSENDYPK